METFPSNWRDRWVWPVLRAVWEPFSRKRSHAWHWQEYRGFPRYRIRIAGRDLDWQAKERGGWWSNFVQTNFGWEKVIILQPKEEGRYRYQIGFRTGLRADALERSRQMSCSIVVSGPCALLVGPNPVEFFAYSYPDGWSIQLQVMGFTPKKMLNKDIPLL